MEAPKHICEQVYRLHEWCRLGWVGEDRLSPDEPLNKGRFALLQLYHAYDAARTYYGDPWNDRGPIFGRPFNRDQRVPIMLTLLEPAAVLTGSFLCSCDGCLAGADPCHRLGCGHSHQGVLLRRWMMSIGERMMRAAEERGRIYQTELDNLAGEIGSEMHWHAKKDGAVIPEPHKFLTEDDKAVLSGETAKGVKDAFVNNIAQGGTPLT